MTDVRKALFQSTLAKYVCMIIGFVNVMVLARLLTPEEIGVFSVAVIVTVIAHLLRDFGVGTYIIQTKELTTEKLKSAFLVSLIFGWSLALLVYLSADMMGEFFNEKGVSQIVEILSLTFLLSPFASISVAVIKRNMEFDKILTINVGATLVQATTAITLAYLNYGYISLAWSSFAGAIATILIVSFLRPKEVPYLPGIKHLKEVLSFGGKIGASSIIGAIGQQTPIVIIGKFLDMHSVGIYGKAEATIQLFNKSVMEGLKPVFFSYFSKANRDGEDIAYPYLYIVSCITVIAWPFFLFLGIFAEQIISLLYGSQWLEAVPLIQVLCIGASIWMFTSMFEQVFIAIGKVNEVLRFQIWMMILRIIIVVIAAPFGLFAIVCSTLILSVIRTLYVLPLLSKSLGVKLSYFKKPFILGAATTLTLMVPLVIGKYYLELGGLQFLLISIPMTAFLWLLSIYVFAHPIKKELNSVYIKALNLRK